MKKYSQHKIQLPLIVFLFCFVFVGITYAQTATVEIGSNTTAISSAGASPYGSSYHDDRTQMLYLASELQAAGLTAGKFTMIGFDVATVNPSYQWLNNFKIKIRHTSSTYLSGFQNMSSGVVYINGYPHVNSGWNNHYSNNFTWNGTDNIIVEVSFDNTSSTSNSSVRYTYQSGGKKVWSKYSNSYSGPAENMSGGYGYYYRPNLKIKGSSIPTISFPSAVSLSGDASPDYGHNFIHVLNPLTSNGDSGAMIESVNYLDGLGRQLQSNAYKASGSGTKDIIVPTVYDDFGRQNKSYLPFASAKNGDYHDTATNTSNFTGYYGSAEDDYVFSEKLLEASPLSRVKEQGAPGTTWRLNNNKTIQFESNNNTTNEVRLWKVNSNGDLTSSSYYTQHRLYKTITKDENWTSGTNHSTEEFKDKQGRVVLKRAYESGAANAKHDTYYVYDKYGNLTFVLPPEAEGTTNSSISSTALSGLCYQYKYDSRNRLVKKKIPGKGWESIVYDLLDRPVLTQDANQDTSKEWLFTKYDGLGRAIYTGIYTHGTNIDQAAMQTEFNNQNTTDASLYETKLTSSGTLGIYYSNSDFPNASIEVLTVNYYDNYTFDKSSLGTIPSSVQSQTINQNIVKGLPTGSKVKVLDQSPAKWITTATYYDNKARAIYSTSDNAYLDTQDKVEMKLDFRGKVTKSKSNHVKGTNTAIVIEEDFTYDGMERLKTHKHKKDTQAQETLAINTYDDLGQLTSKGIGNAASSGTRLQTVNYDYNIRGWLKNINDVNSLGNDLFAFHINYNNPELSPLTISPLYNGNISETTWKTANDNKKRAYGYVYDKLNRLKVSRFTDVMTAYTGEYNAAFSYDKNGNLKILIRNTVDGSSNKKIDDLTYDYFGSSNRLSKVTDAMSSTEGFNDDNKSGNDYDYDNNGNMTQDLNKGIGANGITYNHLNLPTLIDFGSNNKIAYFYDATGMKLRKEVTENSNTISTDYAGKFNYKEVGGTTTLEFIHHAEGYINNNSGSFNYVYQYKDHLDNIRLSYNNIGTTSSINLQILEENNYYPFGLRHKGYNNNPIANHPYKYNGVELEKSLGLDLYEMDVRSYDPAIARFTSIDPVTHFTSSPYNAFDNNPVVWADPSGADAESFVMDLFYRSSNGENWSNNNDGTFSSNRGQTANCNDCSGVQLYEVGKYNNTLPEYDYSAGSKSFGIGEYDMTPYYRDGEIVAYGASRNGRLEYVVAVGSIGIFQENAEIYTSVANLFYINGTPDPNLIAWSQGEISGLGGLWADALTDPNYYFYLASLVSSGGRNPNRTVTKQSARSLGAAGRSWKNVKIINTNVLKKQGIDAHALKRDYLGNKAKISRYDLYKHTDTGEILIFEKGGKGTPIFTGQYIN